MQADKIIICAFVVVIASAFLHDLIPPAPSKTVGIDLGTTYSCVGIFNTKTSTVDIFPDAQGNRVIPTIVAFEGNSVLVGYEARAQSVMNPNNTIFDVKRFIGRSYEQVISDTDLGLYPFHVINKGGKVNIQATKNGKIVDFSPETLSSFILSRLKQQAEKALGSTVNKVVLAVPVEFNEEQKKATEEAGKIAGLEVIRMISEPTAAAMAYGLHKKQNGVYVIVYDFGGGTLDVSLLRIEDGVFQVVAKSGDKHLGGEDFNHNLMEYFMKILKERFNINFGEDTRLMQALRQEVERVKLQLSTSNEATLILDSINFQQTITRDFFEKLNSDLFERSLIPVSKVLERSSIKREDVEEVVLVGGTTRLPRIRSMLQNYFNQVPNCSINPEEAVAIGTAVQAGILSDTKGIPIAAVET